MRPYFAIIKDSFRAALASRVLYVLLIFITLLLLVIAPLHIRETLDWQLSERGFNTQGVAKALVERQGKPDQAVMTRVWELIPDEDNFKDQLIALVEKEEAGEVEPETDDEEGRRGRRRRGRHRRRNRGRRAAGDHRRAELLRVLGLRGRHVDAAQAPRPGEDHFD